MLRGVERIVAVIIGGVAIYLGFRLFFSLPQDTDNEGRILLPGGISIYLSRLGPGTFFALFGIIVVTVSFVYPVQYQKWESPSDRGSDRGYSISAFEGQDRSIPSDTDLAQLRQDISDLHDALLVLSDDNPDQLELKQIRRRLEIRLDQLKLGLLRLHWRPTWGKFEAFRDWCKDADPNKRIESEEFREPAELFFHGQEETQ